MENKDASPVPTKTLGFLAVSDKRGIKEKEINSHFCTKTVFILILLSL